jgi:N-acetylmuramoyl-L-alanine amidase
MVAKALLDTLEWYGNVIGGNVIYTRLTDTFIRLLDRPDTANTVNAKTFISIHHNSAGSTAVQGTETFYCDNSLTSSDCGDWKDEWRNPFDTLAVKVYMRIRDAFGYNPRGAREEATVDGLGLDDASGIDISDFVYLQDYMFDGGSLPPACP